MVASRMAGREEGKNRIAPRQFGVTFTNVKESIVCSNQNSLELGETYPWVHDCLGKCTYSTVRLENSIILFSFSFSYTALLSGEESEYL